VTDIAGLVTEVPGELADLPAPSLPWMEWLTVPSFMRVLVLREPRDHCSNCRRRRVLYRLQVVTAAGGDKTAARCAPCWGIR
jgi:hypothetical protein